MSGAVDAAKQAIRERVWANLDLAGAVPPPGAKGRIPDFIGAEQAAQRLAELPAWQRAQVVKAVPGKPQLPVRVLALEAGKLVCLQEAGLTGPETEHDFRVNLIVTPDEVISCGPLEHGAAPRTRSRVTWSRKTRCGSASPTTPRAGRPAPTRPPASAWTRRSPWSPAGSR